MLISRVSEGAGEGDEVRDDHSHEYETAAEIFELIAKNTLTPSNPVTESDLVILYKNIDVGPNVMPPAPSPPPVRCNQRVETVVHSGEDSDLSELEDVISSHDLPPSDVYLINEERIDLLNNPPSLENTLCHKFGDLEIKMSNLGTDILFKSATIKEQLDNLKLMSSSHDLDSKILPSSLLDYICCKRLEDNYTFYMENIIRYVKHTIDQLKRISNGDYLTEKAKEKWREISEETVDEDSNKKILAASTSIPLHVERKRTGRKTTWDDIVHSEMDIRSLSKILEKKIFLEVPKMICGSYKLFSKQCTDNLIISCEKKSGSKELVKRDSRVDVVVKLKRSRSGHVISNINSIMILQGPPALPPRAVIALPFRECKEDKEDFQKIVELVDKNDETDKNIETDRNDERDKNDETDKNDQTDKNTVNEETEYEEVSSDPTENPSEDCSYAEKSDTSIPLKDVFNVRCGNYQQEAAFMTIPDELSISMKRLDIQSSLNEESAEDFPESTVSRKKSPKIRIKSPYENKSHLIEEKKRKKLLEIRERREKRKIALSESCKIMKHRRGKGALTPQASSSVTTLSITNKSFYNSIYGQTAGLKQSHKRKVRRDDLGGEGQFHGETDTSFQASLDTNRKYTNKTYYLDDAVTEMYMQMKGEDSKLSPSLSVGTSELAAQFSTLSQQFMPSVTDFNEKDTTSLYTCNSKADIEKLAPSPNESRKSHSPNRSKKSSPNRSHSPKKSVKPPSTTPRYEDDMEPNIAANTSDHNLVPKNSFTRLSDAKQPESSNVSTVECRKSIEKLYDLLKNIRQVNRAEKRSGNVCSVSVEATTFRESSDLQGSDSGTSLKHHLTCSETSGFSFDNNKYNNNASTSYDAMPPQMTNRSSGGDTSVVPKVIISSKLQIKAEADKRKKDKKVCFVAPKVVPENPLKAISQLLHEFDNAQKNRLKSAEERPAKPKKYESNAGGDRASRQAPIRGRSRLDQHMKAAEPVPPKTNVRDRRQVPPVVEVVRPPHRPDEKFGDKVAKKKMSEIIDEVREARGEAVRGPPKTSRLNTLAQPKKSYVQAHSEEYQTKYGRNLMADRLHRLAASSPTEKHASSPTEKHAPFPRAKQKRPGTEAVSAVSVRPAPTHPPPIESPGKKRLSPGSSPARKRSPEVKRQPELPGTIKEKMAAVECYVKSHFPVNQHVPKKSRVPLLPCDLELASMPADPSFEESTAIGSQLHNLIDTMINQAPGLAPLSEGLNDINTNDVYVTEDLSKNEDRLQPFDSDTSDIFKDNIHTAVEQYRPKVDNRNIESTENIKVIPERQYTSSTELQRLENALYRQLSIGNFQKRLRIKNLTITPKQSMQHVVVVESGDVGSVLLKTSLSQDFELKHCSFTNNIAELKNSIPMLTSPDVAWRHTQIPMQISTIGYASLQYRVSNQKIVKSNEDKSNRQRQREMKSDHNMSNRSSLTKDYTCQTFKGKLSNQGLEYPHQCENRGTSCDEKKPNCEKDIPIATLLSNLTKNFTKSDGKCDGILDEEIRNEKTLPSENKESNIPKVDNKADDIEYSTSLDMLVGLLNEIQKITQAQVTNLAENTQCRQLENLLNNAATLENCMPDYPEELITISALDKNRVLDSSPSSYSFYITKSEDFSKKDNQMPDQSTIQSAVSKSKPTYVDKGVSVEVPEIQYRNNLTDVPSGFLTFPITMNTSTSVTNSLMGVLSEPSTASMFSCTDILYYDNLAHSQNKIVELADNYNSNESVINDCITKEVDDPKFNALKRIEEKVEVDETKTVKRANTAYVNKVIHDCITKVDDETKLNALEQVEVVKSKKVKRRKIACVSKDLDPLMRFKRDVLVTVYSMLVLTVFAALSVPDLLYLT